MRFGFTDPIWLWLLLPAWGWTLWWHLRSDVALSPRRRAAALATRALITLLAILALAGFEWRKPLEGMNAFFLLDVSKSVPGEYQPQMLKYIQRVAADKEKADRAGIIVFGDGASIEINPSPRPRVEKLQAVVGRDRTDVAGAIRLGAAAFPEAGQKRLVLISDGNQNTGDAVEAAAAARSLGVTLDVVPVEARREMDVAIRRVTAPGRVRKAQPFELEAAAYAPKPCRGALRVYENNRFLGEQIVDLVKGKNLFVIPVKGTGEGFYRYEVQLDVPGDAVPQNNRGSAFAYVRGEPRVLIVSSAPDQDGGLYRAILGSGLKAELRSADGFPEDLAELQSFDAIALSNVGAGDLGKKRMELLRDAVRDFGVGLVCVGGDQAYGAGGYRGTPLEEALPVRMDLSSRKVLPRGAVVLIMHGMEFNNGNQVARECALGVLDALGPRDEMGVLLWDGKERWLFPLSEAGDKKEKGRLIAGMNQGDLPSFQNLMRMAYAGGGGSPGLKDSTANLKHIIVFSDGDPAPPSEELMRRIVDARITVSTVLIAGHAGPQTMIRMAEQGKGRFYNVRDPNQLPQIFLKEASVVLKSAIVEQPFTPRAVGTDEILRGLGPLPQLLGYVAVTPKPRAEVPLLAPENDPLLAHWNYGLGRALAFTSDARGRWAVHWLGWPRFQQFWGQAVRWALRRVNPARLTPRLTIENGRGELTVEAVDAQGNYRNFLNLQAAILDPQGKRRVLPLEQTAPGRYQAAFDASVPGAYVANVMELEGETVVGTAVAGASLNYSPEYLTTEPNWPLLERLAQVGGGKLLGPLGPRAGNPFRHDRRKTFRPVTLWPVLLKLAILLFLADIAIRRVDIDREEWARAWIAFRRRLPFGRAAAPPAQEESLDALLARRRAAQEAMRREPPPPAAATPAAPAPTGPPTKPPADRRPKPAEEPQGAGRQPSEPEGSLTERLLRAKREATRRIDEAEEDSSR